MDKELMWKFFFLYFFNFVIPELTINNETPFLVFTSQLVCEPSKYTHQVRCKRNMAEEVIV